MRSLGLFIVAVTMTTASGAEGSQRYDQPIPGARSPRNASYDIDVRLEPGDRSLHGKERIHWRNISSRKN